MKKIIGILSFFSFIFSFALAQDKPTMILFYGETCPHCKVEKWYIDQLSEKYDFDLVKYEVYFDQDNQKLMEEYADKLWARFDGVPTVIMWNDYFMGVDFQETERLLKKYTQLPELKITEEKINPIIDKPIIEKTVEVTTKNVTQESEVNLDQEDSQIIYSWEDIQETISTWENIILNTEENLEKDQTTKLLGKEISLKTVWPVIFWILLWLADWINPCMFWVLIFLLTYLISIWSKKKVLYSWLIFVVTTFVLYFGIMYLMHKLIFTTMAILPYIAYIKYWIWVLAIFMWLIEIKDFFWYGKWISLAIPSFMKPTLEYVTMKWTYMSAFILAILSSFVELPCTIGIPLSYVGAVGDKMDIFLALGIYNIFFIIPLLVIILWIYFGFSAFKSWDQEMTVNKLSNKRLMRLFAWIILVGIGILFLMRIL